MSGFGDCIWDGSPGGGGFWIVFSSVSAPHFVSVSSPMGILLSLQRRNEVSKFLVFLLLELHVVYELYMSIWANIHLSVSAYRVCSFVTELPHSG